MDYGNHKSLEAVAVQLGLILVLLVISLGGNATVGALLIRFKKLRTIPNILIANMALVDLLNSIINMPIFICHSVLHVEALMAPKDSAFAISLLYKLFFSLNISSMVLIAADRYGAIAHGLKYMMWKTRKKAYVAVGLVWILSVVVTTVTHIPLSGINIQNGTVVDYRKAQFQYTGRYIVAITVPLLVATTGVLSMLTCRAMVHRREKLHHLFHDVSFRIRLKREQDDVKATKTMIITFVTYLFSYIPLLVYTISISTGPKIDYMWLRFFATFTPLVSSGCNPIIYALRTRRFRHAFSQFWKDPCGKSPLQEIGKEETAKRRRIQPAAQTYQVYTLSSLTNEETFYRSDICSQGENAIEEDTRRSPVAGNARKRLAGHSEVKERKLSVRVLSYSRPRNQRRKSI